MNYVFKDSKFNYKVLVPKNKGAYIDFAASEVVRLFEKATGVIIEVTQNVIDGEKYFSIGETDLFKKGGYSIDKTTLGEEGYRFFTDNNQNYYVVGGAEIGTAFGVYKYFEEMLSYEHYAIDETKIAVATQIPFKDFDITDIPDIKSRCMSMYDCRGDRLRREHATRLKGIGGFGEYIDGTEYWGSWAHNHFYFVPFYANQHKHPDWFSPEQTQLCYTNDEVVECFVENLKKHILQKKDQKYFMLGHRDSSTCCLCDNCKARIKEIGMSGLSIEFHNKIAKKISEWQKEVCPEREIWLVPFAYGHTEDAPVKEVDGKLVPIEPCCVPEKNVKICLALLYHDLRKPLDDEKYNPKSAKLLKGWQAITKDIMVWTYYNKFDETFDYFDGFDAYFANLKIFHKLGTNWYFPEAGGGTYGSQALSEMYMYVFAKTAWNTTLDPWKLCDDFMDNYYKDGADAMKCYHRYLYNYYNNTKNEYERKYGVYLTTYWCSDDPDWMHIQTDKFFSKKYFEDLKNLIDEAISAVKSSWRSTDDKQKLIKRIEFQSLTGKTQLLKIYGKTLEKDEALLLIEDIDRIMTESGKLNQEKEKLLQKFKGWTNL